MLDNVQSLITLDVYDHDTTPSTIKSIACDDNTRYVMAELTEQGAEYDLPSDASVSLTVLRPDKTGVGIVGSAYPYTTTDTDDEGESTEVTKYLAYAELDQAAIAISGILYAQFKIETGTQILRTEIFRILNGRALDAEISDWSGTYQSYNLDELVEKVDFIANAIKDITGDDVDINAAIGSTHAYVDSKVLQMQTYTDQKVASAISVHDNGLYITT